MEEDTINSPKDLFGNNLEAIPKKPVLDPPQQHLNGHRYRFLKWTRNPRSRSVPFHQDKEHQPDQQRQSPGPLKRSHRNTMKRTELGSMLLISKERRYFPFQNWWLKWNQRLFPTSLLLPSKVQEIGRNKTGNLQWALKIHWYPIIIVLPSKFRYLGCRAALGESSREQRLYKTLPASA